MRGWAIPWLATQALLQLVLAWFAMTPPSRQVVAWLGAALVCLVLMRIRRTRPRGPASVLPASEPELADRSGRDQGPPSVTAEGAGSLPHGGGMSDPYPAWPEDERSEQAKAAGLPHRYRGGRLMAVGLPAGVVVFRITGLGWDGEAPTYLGELVGGEPVVVGEHLVIPPDPAELRASLETVGPRGRALSAADAHRLRRSYVWVSMRGGSTDDPDGLVLGCIRRLDLVWGRPPEPDDALLVWSGRERAEGTPGGEPHWIARIPLLAACRLADGRALAIDYGEPHAVVLDSDLTLRFAAEV